MDSVSSGKLGIGAWEGLRPMLHRVRKFVCEDFVNPSSKRRRPCVYGWKVRQRKVSVVVPVKAGVKIVSEAQITFYLIMLQCIRRTFFSPV